MTATQEKATAAAPAKPDTKAEAKPAQPEATVATITNRSGKTGKAPVYLSKIEKAAELRRKADLLEQEEYDKHRRAVTESLAQLDNVEAAQRKVDERRARYSGAIVAIAEKLPVDDPVRVKALARLAKAETSINSES